MNSNKNSTESTLPNPIEEKLRLKVITIINSRDIQSFLNNLFWNYLGNTGRFNHWELEDLVQDLYFHLFSAISKRIELGWSEEQLDLYFTPALIKTSSRNYVVDCLRSKSSRVPIVSNLEDEDNKFILESARNTDNSEFSVLMEEYLITDNINQLEEKELLEEVFVNLNSTQTQILSCIVSPSDEFIAFSQFYLLELGIKTESLVISKYLEISPKFFFEEMGVIRGVISKVLGIKKQAPENFSKN